MPSKTETGPSFVNTFETHEAKKPNHEEGSLRDELLSASERRGNGVFIPMGTVAVEGNSRNLTPESFFENSDNVTKLREKQNYLTGNVEGNATRLRGGRQMSRLDREFGARQEQEPNGNNLTFLYDEKAKVDENELHIPSAVLVHEKLNEEEVARLRETLPPEVPILDAKTNELLDSVGQEKREQRRERRLAEFDLGFIALAEILSRGNFQPDMSSFVKRHNSRSFRVGRDGRIDEFYAGFARNIHTMYGNTTDAYDGFVANSTADAHTRRAAADGYDYGRWDTGKPRTYEAPKTEERVKEPAGANPESEEVRKHREEQEAKARQEEEMRANAERSMRAGEARRREMQQEAVDKHKMVDEMAREATGKSVYDLDDSELKSFYRKTSREYHPDAETGNADTFRAVNEVMKDIKDSREKAAAEAAPAPENEPTSEPESTSESEPDAENP